jgi:hypothetical protein
LEPLHKLSGSVIYAFLVLHLANHFLGLMGPETHLEVMAVMRLIYRHPIAECVLFLAFVIQVITGTALVREIWVKKKDFIHQLYAASGLLIMVFLLTHVGQMLYARFFEHTDSNIYYVAAGFVAAPSRDVMTGVYALGLMALFLHFACAGYSIFKKDSKTTGYVVMAIVLILGGVSTWALTAMLRGDLFPLNIPEEYSPQTVSEDAVDSVGAVAESAESSGER